MSIITKTLVKSQSIHYYNLNKTFRTTHKRRCESVDKYSITPSYYNINDREAMIQEMSKLLKEIKIKAKEFKTLSNTNLEIESDNIKLVQIIEGLISECKQIPQPIEKHNSIDLTKQKSLYNKIKDKLQSYQQELMSKDNCLNELITNDQKIHRMYEIEGKLINANEQYENMYMKYVELAKVITQNDQQSKKASEETNMYKINTVKLEKEKNELIEKIRFNEIDNTELTQKEVLYDEKIHLIKNKYVELRKMLKEKNKTLRSLKDKIIEHQSIALAKAKTDSMITNQLKQIQVLKETSDKKNKQIKESDNIQLEYINRINLLKSNAQVNSHAFLMAQKDKNEIDNEYAMLQKNNMELKEKKKALSDRLFSQSYEIQKQIFYSFNIPLQIKLEFDYN